MYSANPYNIYKQNSVNMASSQAIVTYVIRWSSKIYKNS